MRAVCYDIVLSNFDGVQGVWTQEVYYYLKCRAKQVAQNLHSRKTSLPHGGLSSSEKVLVLQNQKSRVSLVVGLV